MKKITINGKNYRWNVEKMNNAAFWLMIGGATAAGAAVLFLLFFGYVLVLS